MDRIKSKLLFEEATYKIIGAAMEVHKILGSGFLEAVYEEALAHEFDLKNIGYERQKTMDVKYKGVIAKQYVADFVVEGKVLVELKAMRNLTELEKAQVQNYLKGTGIRIGLLVNFGESSLKYKRIIR